MLDIESYKNTQSGTTEEIYTQKYLKYKNKYLELKNMIGGKALNIEEIKQLWDAPGRKQHNISIPALMELFEQYCWIGPPLKKVKTPKKGKIPKIDKVQKKDKYGIGFFLYKCKEGVTIDSKYEVFSDGKDRYAVWKITPANLGAYVPLQETEELVKQFDNSPNIFTTSVALPINDEPLVKKGSLQEGTKYRWEHENRRWIYKTNDGKYYEGQFKL